MGSRQDGLFGDKPSFRLLDSVLSKRLLTGEGGFAVVAVVAVVVAVVAVVVAVVAVVAVVVAVVAVYGCGGSPDPVTWTVLVSVSVVM